MKKKFMAFGCFVVAFSICATISLAKEKADKTDVTIATAKNYYAVKSETTTSSSLGNLVSDVVGGMGSGSSGGISDIIGGIGSDSFGSIGDAIGGIGDSLGSIGSDSFSSSFGSGLSEIVGGLFGVSDNTTMATTVATTSGNIGLIIPVPAATQEATETTTSTVTTQKADEGETVDYAATSNPYTKPTGTFAAGDQDETIKWLQWIFIYTHYGLEDDGITGVLDEDTVAVVKKLQHENSLTVDGNITEDVIKAAEVLYYQTILGDDVSAIEVSLEATAGESVSYQAAESDGENDIPVALLVVVLVIIWILAIGGIVLLFVFKKKKLSAKNGGSKEDTIIEQNTTAETQTEENKTEISSMSDLFEDADKK